MPKYLELDSRPFDHELFRSAQQDKASDAIEQLVPFHFPYLQLTIKDCEKREAPS